MGYNKMGNEIDSLVELVIADTGLPTNSVVKKYTRRIIVYLEQKYGFITRLMRERQVDDGVNYGNGE